MRLTLKFSILGAILFAMVAGDLGLRGLLRAPEPPSWPVPGGDAARGRHAIGKYGCGSCHTIGGIQNATAQVGPQLRELRSRGYIAGKLPNAPYTLVFWIENPQRFAPGTAMPNLGVTEAEAKDIAAYLY